MSTLAFWNSFAVSTNFVRKKSIVTRQTTKSLELIDLKSFEADLEVSESDHSEHKYNASVKTLGEILFN